ncbi:MAG TPA: hypothetical protein EYP58_05930 [bacterium (Candidatus Stahlbacteria)]|nr:hypothetical protein [Candidatus Stahlbacteria bacterium]
MRIAPNLTKIDSFEICNPSDPTLVQTYPAVAFNGQNYIVTWSDEKIGGANYYYTVVARVSPQGVVLDTGACISNGTGGSELRPDIAFDGNRCLVVWPKSSTGIFGRFVNRSGLPEGNIITIVAGYAGGAAIAYGSTNYLVIYYAGSYPDLKIYGRIVDTNGNLVGNVINIATSTGCHRMGDVVFDGSKVLIVWMKGESTQEIWGQFVDVDGSLIGNNFQISDASSTRRWYPAVATSDRNALVVWHQGTSAYDVYGNVDISTVGVEEEERRHFTDFVATIISGPIWLPKDRNCRIYDISGREIKPERAKPGVYFLEIDGRISQKVVKIR